jgi:hypothetical protein
MILLSISKEKNIKQVGKTFRKLLFWRAIPLIVCPSMVTMSAKESLKQKYDLVPSKISILNGCNTEHPSPLNVKICAKIMCMLENDNFFLISILKNNLNLLRIEGCYSATFCKSIKVNFH